MENKAGNVNRVCKTKLMATEDKQWSHFFQLLLSADFTNLEVSDFMTVGLKTQFGQKMSC